MVDVVFAPVVWWTRKRLVNGIRVPLQSLIGALVFMNAAQRMAEFVNKKALQIDRPGDLGGGEIEPKIGGIDPNIGLVYLISIPI